MFTFLHNSSRFDFQFSFVHFIIFQSYGEPNYNKLLNLSFSIFTRDPFLSQTSTCRETTVSHTPHKGTNFGQDLLPGHVVTVHCLLPNTRIYRVAVMKRKSKYRSSVWDGKKEQNKWPQNSMLIRFWELISSSMSNLDEWIFLDIAFDIRCCVW